MKLHHPALHDGTEVRSRRVLRIAGPKTVHIEACLDFVQAVVDTVPECGTPAPQHDLSVGPTYLILPTLKHHPQVGLHREANAPRLVRRCDVQTVARTIAETRQRRRRCRRLPLKLYLLRLERC